MDKLHIELDEVEKELKALFNYGFISAGTYIDLREDMICRRGQAEVSEYYITDDKLNEYYS